MTVAVARDMIQIIDDLKNMGHAGSEYSCAKCDDAPEFLRWHKSYTRVMLDEFNVNWDPTIVF